MQTVKVVGDIDSLGAWDPSAGIALASDGTSTLTGQLDVAPGTPFQYKYVTVGADGSVSWEDGANRAAVAPQSGNAVIDQ